MCSPQLFNSNTIDGKDSQYASPLMQFLALSNIDLTRVKYGPQQIERAKNYKRELVLKIQRSFDDKPN